MIPYYIMIGAPLLLSFFLALSNDHPSGIPAHLKKKNYPILLFFIIFFVLLALRRSDIGVDLSGYIRNFESFRLYTWKEVFTSIHWEAGFIAFSKAIGDLTASSQLYVAIVAAVTVFPIARLYYQESEDDTIVMALFMIFPMFLVIFSGLRQMVAVAFAPAVYQAVRKHRLLPAVLLSLAAMCFHASAIVLLLLYPVCHLKLKTHHLFFILPTTLLLFVFSRPIYYLLLPLIGEDYATRYGTLTETNSTTIFLMLLLFTLYAFLLPDESEMDETTESMRNILVLALFLQVFASISTVAMRINYYFIIFIPLLVPKITARITRVDPRYLQLIRLGMSAFFLIYHIIKIHRVDNLNIYPYAFFWQ